MLFTRCTDDNKICQHLITVPIFVSSWNHLFNFFNQQCWFLLIRKSSSEFQTIKIWKPFWCYTTRTGFHMAYVKL